MIFGKSIGILKKLYEKGVISAADLHIAEFLTSFESNLQESEKTLFAILTAIVSNSISSGNICLTAEDVTEFLKNDGETVEFFPKIDVETVKSILRKS